VPTTNDGTQHTPSDATHSDSRASKRVRWNQEKTSDTITNSCNEALRITDKTLIAVHIMDDDKQRTSSDAIHPDSRVPKRVRWNQEKSSDTITNNCNEALRITDKTLIAVHIMDDDTQRTPSDAIHHDSRVPKRVRWNQEELSNTTISDCNEASLMGRHQESAKNESLIAVPTTNDDAQSIPSNTTHSASRVSSTARWRPMEPSDAIVENASYDFAVKDTMMKLTLMFPEQVTTARMKKIKEVAIEGYKLADDVYTARDAEEWGNHYKVPYELIQSNEALFRAGMRDIKVMAKRRQQQLLSR
jgi:hypothetical protein